MLEYLIDVEKRMPELLGSDEEIAKWKTKLVLYEKPLVERLWLQDGENRIYLHCIHPVSASDGEQPFRHPHPWPSAVKILSGRYVMEFGQEAGPVSRMILTEGSMYEMTDFRLIHSVSPITNPSLSLMVTGPAYKGVPQLPPDVREKNTELHDFRVHQLVQLFREHYGINQGE